MVDTNQMLTLEQLCERLNISRYTYYRWRKDGDGPAGFRLRPGPKGLRFDPAEVDAWLESRREQQAAG